MNPLSRDKISNLAWAVNDRIGSLSDVAAGVKNISLRHS
jgi:hypothetical protein